MALQDTMEEEELAMDSFVSMAAAAASTLHLREFLFSSVNLTEEDLDYYLNYTGQLAGLPSNPFVVSSSSSSASSSSVTTSTTISSISSIIINTTTTLTDLEDEGEDGFGAGCGIGLHKIRSDIHFVHGYLSVLICVIGCLANIVNILVLSQRDLRRTAINRILCSLAVADFLLMLEYIPFACHMYLFPGRDLESFYSYPWAVFVLFHAHFTLVCHTISIWLTLSLAFWRYEVLKNGRHVHERRKSGRRRCHQERCTRTIITAYVGSILLCIPSFVTFGIEQQEVNTVEQQSSSSWWNATSSSSSSSNASPPSTTATSFIYKVNLNPIAQNYDGIVHKAHLWTYSVVMKLGPCLVLTVLTCWLVRRLWDAERHHQSLATFSRMNNASTRASTTTAHGGNNNPHQSAGNRVIIQPNEEISFTQQLEMRQLASAMTSSVAATTAAAAATSVGNVQIIVTEVPSASGDHNHIGVGGGRRNRTMSPQYSSTVLDCSSYVMGIGPSMVLDDGTSINLPSRVVEDEVTIAPEGDNASAPPGLNAPHPPVDRDGAGGGGDEEDEAAASASAAANSASARRRQRKAKMSLNMTSQQRHKHQTDRTTRMLVAVLVVFLITEIPQGVVALLSGVLGRQFFTRCYTTGMGEILDLLALLNSAINFLLYCSMSRAFRRAARAQFFRMTFRQPPTVINNHQHPMTNAEPINVNAVAELDHEQPIGCCSRSNINCFQRGSRRYVTGSFQLHQPINISPSNPTRCTQL